MKSPRQVDKETGQINTMNPELREHFNIMLSILNCIMRNKKAREFLSIHPKLFLRLNIVMDGKIPKVAKNAGECLCLLVGHSRISRKQIFRGDGARLIKNLLPTKDFHVLKLIIASLDTCLRESQDRYLL